ncbi:hypothetical protein CTI12_AA128810 [Artemisia annua]|uniref:Uncharacterized protein n=1 Tax=Artemisia annua TaxID=35608 RepID=A0A2U1NLP0_ARTAN|nr:hypothetical protein CTI12_AA128810 [Artemisia annua]
MSSTDAISKSSNQGCDVQPMQPSYMPYSEKNWGLDKSNLDDERIYAESEVLFHKKLIRFMDISLEEWLEIKYRDPEFAPMNEVKRIVTSWLTRSFKEQFNEFMEIKKKMISSTSFDVNFDPNDVDFSDWSTVEPTLAQQHHPGCDPPEKQAITASSWSTMDPRSKAVDKIEEGVRLLVEQKIQLG